MKIKIAVVDSEELYLERLVSSFNDFYANDVELFTFSDVTLAEKALTGRMVDVFLLNEKFNEDNVFANLPFQTKAYGYLTESKDIDEIKGYKAVCKYQKAELIYKGIIGLLAESDSGTIYVNNASSENTKIYVVTSASGGTGVSCMAAGFAKYLAKSGKRTFYFDYQQISSVDSLFTGEGTYGLSDIIFALVSKKSNLSVKIKTYAKTDPSGVHFLSGCKYLMDISEFTDENMITLVSEMEINGDYDCIVIDMPFSCREAFTKICSKAYKILFVSDASGSCNDRTQRVMESFRLIDGKLNTSRAKNSVMVFNKYQNENAVSENGNLPEIMGAIPFFQNARNSSDVSERISSMGMWQKLLM